MMMHAGGASAAGKESSFELMMMYLGLRN